MKIGEKIYILHENLIREALVWNVKTTTVECHLPDGTKIQTTTKKDISIKVLPVYGPGASVIIFNIEYVTYDSQTWGYTVDAVKDQLTAHIK